MGIHTKERADKLSAGFYDPVASENSPTGIPGPYAGMPFAVEAFSKFDSRDHQISLVELDTAGYSSSASGGTASLWSQRGLWVRDAIVSSLATLTIPNSGVNAGFLTWTGDVDTNGDNFQHNRGTGDQAIAFNLGATSTQTDPGTQNTTTLYKKRFFETVALLGSADQDVFLGFAVDDSNPFSGGATSFVGFYHTSAVGWRFVMDTGGPSDLVSGETATLVAAADLTFGQAYRLAFLQDLYGAIHYYVDGVHKGSITDTTNRPASTAILFPMISVAQTAAGAIGGTLKKFLHASEICPMYKLLALWAALLLLAAPAWAVDQDGDGIDDPLDNCTLISNAGSAHCDTDLDGYGNACDSDLNNDGIADSADYLVFSPDFQTGQDSGVGSDINCDGVVDSGDYPKLFEDISGGVSPGFSGLSCAGTIPCASSAGLGDLTVDPDLVEPWHGGSSTVKYPTPTALGFPYDYTNDTYDVSTEAGRAALNTDHGVDCRLQSDDPAGPIAVFNANDDDGDDDTDFAECIANIPGLTEDTAITIDLGGAVLNITTTYLNASYNVAFWSPWTHYTNGVFECYQNTTQGACIGITARGNNVAGHPPKLGEAAWMGFTSGLQITAPADTRGATLLTVPAGTLGPIEVDKDIAVVWGDPFPGYSAGFNRPIWQTHFTCVNASNTQCGANQVRLARPIPITLTNPYISTIGGPTSEFSGVMGLKFSDLTIRWNTPPTQKWVSLFDTLGANRFEMTGVTMGPAYSQLAGSWKQLSESWIHKNVFLDLTENRAFGKSQIFLKVANDNVIENNIFAGANRGLTFDERNYGGSSLNVVAYNYFADDDVIGCKTTPAGQSQVGRHILVHGQAEHMNLIEGNDVTCPIKSDSFHGCPGPYQVMYRNRSRAGTQIAGSTGFRASGWIAQDWKGSHGGTLCFDKYTFIANTAAYSISGEVNGFDSAMSNSHLSYNRTSDAHGTVDGFAGCRLTAEGLALDTSGKCSLFGGGASSNLTWVNNTWDQDAPTAGSDTLNVPTSLYLSSEPDWWDDDPDVLLCEWDHDGIGAWGDDFSGDLCKLPAEVRCIAGEYGSC